ncbi:MAG: hypothetical protein P8Q27_03710 [Flavicella sp.]|nr:hypothetical protein [Flavicella sp.]
MKRTLPYILFLLSFVGFSQEDSSISVSLDTARIRLGETLEYTISVQGIGNVGFPELERLGALELLSSKKADTFSDRLEKKYLLTGFDSGSFYVPKQQVFLQDKAYFTDSLLVQVATVAVDTLKQKPFDNKPIVEEPWVFDDFKPYLSNVFLLLGILLLLAAGYFVYKKYYKKETAPPKESIPAYRDALQKLTQLDKKQLWQNNQTKAYYVELTEIVRVYIGREVGIHTLEATTAELIPLLQQANRSKEIGIAPKSVESLAGLLKNADFVKFAKLRPLSHAIQNDRRVAEKLLQDLESVLQKHKQASVLETEVEASDFEKKPALLRKGKKKKTILYFAIFLTAFSTILWLFTNNSSDQNNSSKKSYNSSSNLQELTPDKWQVYSFGNPPMTMRAPMNIPLQSDTVPLQAQSVLETVGIYRYDNAAAQLEVTVTVLSYVPEIAPQLEQVLQTTLQSMQDQKEIENFEYERQPAILQSKLSGAFLSGKFSQKGTEKTFRLIGFSKENKRWQVLTICKAASEETQTLLNTMLNSIGIEIE